MKPVSLYPESDFLEKEMKAGLFLTGTDTGCGKTYVSCQIEISSSIGLSVVGLKPIASRADTSSRRLVNEDVSLLPIFKC